MTTCSTKHKYVPKCNHSACWSAYFKENIGMSMAGRMCIKKFGEAAFELAKGKKYTKHMLKFVREIDKEKDAQ